jgi:hypothetical protein
MKLWQFYAPKTVVLMVGLVVAVPGLGAQEVSMLKDVPAAVQPVVSEDALPDAPGESSSVQTAAPQAGKAAQPDKPAPQQDDRQQTTRIAGIMPNFRSVSRDVKLPPQSPKDKLLIAGHDTFDYSSFIIVAIQAEFAFQGDSDPQFHHGMVGYGRYYWHTLADTIDENFMVGGVGPVIFHTDSRFYTLGHGGPMKRIPYALSRVVITRKDDGDPTFNFAEVIGAGASAGVSSLYYPTVYRTWTKVGQKWLTGMIIDSANFTLKEYWPDINHYVFHHHKKTPAGLADAPAVDAPK